MTCAWSSSSSTTRTFALLTCASAIEPAPAHRYAAEEIIRSRPLRKRQFDAEHGALADFARRTDRPAVLFDDPFGDCQPQSVAALLGRIVGLEDLLQHVGVHALPGVDHLDHRRV